jgi:hypothetical protein
VRASVKKAPAVRLSAALAVALAQYSMRVLRRTDTTRSPTPRAFARCLFRSWTTDEPTSSAAREASGSDGGPGRRRRGRPWPPLGQVRHEHSACRGCLFGCPHRGGTWASRAEGRPERGDGSVGATLCTREAVFDETNPNWMRRDLICSHPLWNGLRVQGKNTELLF